MYISTTNIMSLLPLDAMYHVSAFCNAATKCQLRASGQEQCQIAGKTWASDIIIEDVFKTNINVTGLTTLIKNGMKVPINTDTLKCAVECDNVTIALWLREQGIMFTDTMIENAIRKGGTNIVLWVFNNAISLGNLELVLYMLENGSSWDENACRATVCGGNLELLKLARAQGAPWDERVCSMAAFLGHTNILKWLRENGCPWNESVCHIAASSGRLNVLKWARAHGAPWNEHTTALALNRKRYYVFRWAVLHGCPVNTRKLFPLMEAVLQSITNQ
jgi:hypothetical protein